MTNFDFLAKDVSYASFADVAISAEKIYHIDPSASAMNTRRSMEFAIKWLYSIDNTLVMPYEETLFGLMTTTEFIELISDSDLINRLHFIRKAVNQTAHSQNIDKDVAMHCLENLFVFLDFVDCCYGHGYVQRVFDKEIVLSHSEPASNIAHTTELDKITQENQHLREELTKRRKTQALRYVRKPLDVSEYATRKLYIDVLLRDIGWKEGANWLNEVEVSGMPNQSGTGFCDYVLYDDRQVPLAVVEAKKTCVDVSKGRQQAKLYADCLEKKHGRRPIVFITNGFDTKIIDNEYNERDVANIYSKRDLEKLFNLRKMKTSLKTLDINKNIAGRYYQENAIKAVCDTFEEKNRRKALLVMATGSGKTRTVIALCDELLKHCWVKNILFLADRTTLVNQAKRNFVNLLPDLTVSNLCEDKKNYTANCVFSTYQTMMNVIDTATDENGKIFTTGHFDLIICDEAHRSIYNKYKDIFTYFDAKLVGLTATPKDEIDKNTYSIFQLENGNPTYGYELSQAVKDNFLVDFLSVETTLKFLDTGIVYDELSDEEKEEYEQTFENENGELPAHISSGAINDWILNKDTIRKALDVLMQNGIHIEHGSKIGKTIIFAKNHAHAEKIHQVFNEEYPHLVNYAKVIDNYINYAQSAIDDFSDSNKMPQIAISVDMLDTGVDVPEVVNLVFFKKVMSKAKFWQMIGRGTRLCPHLIDGCDKEQFYIFDFCGNFEFFRLNQGKASANRLPLQGAMFHIKAQMIFKLQDINYQTDDLMRFRGNLVKDLYQKVGELNTENFAVKQHLRHVEKYKLQDTYKSLTFDDTVVMKDHIAPLILPDSDESHALRFDSLLHGMELAYIVGSPNGRAKSDLLKKVTAISGVSNIQEIKAQADLIGTILHTDYVETAGVNELEHIRLQLRGLIKYIPREHLRYDTDFTDDIVSVDWQASQLENDDLKNYRQKAEFYIKQHQDETVIVKLKSNQRLNTGDIAELERILWSEVGTKEEYALEYGDTPLGEFVRKIVGVSMKAAKEIFSQYLENANLDARQIYFVNQIVEYIVQNGMMTDFTVLQKAPFTDRGSVVELFTDMNVWLGIKGLIDDINGNVVA